MRDCLKNPTQKWPSGHIEVHDTAEPVQPFIF